MPSTSMPSASGNSQLRAIARCRRSKAGFGEKSKSQLRFTVPPPPAAGADEEAPAFTPANMGAVFDRRSARRLNQKQPPPLAAARGRGATPPRRGP